MLFGGQRTIYRSHFSPLPWGFWGLSLGHQAWQQSPVPTESSQMPSGVEHCEKDSLRDLY